MLNRYLTLLRLQRYPMREALDRMDYLSALEERELVNYQQQRSWEIFEYHKANNDWYRAFLHERKISGWNDIPILEKRDIQRPLSEIVTAEYLKRPAYRNNTSGSTGIPFHFAKDKYSHAMTWAYILTQYRNVGLEYGSSLQARFFGIPLSSVKYAKEKVKDWLAARVRFPVFDLSDSVLDNYLRRFYKTPFVYLYGYTSSLVMFAKFIKTRGVKLVEVCPTLRCCVVTSEVCSDMDRALLEDALGVRVINEYGAAELDIVAFENQEGHFLLNEENLYVEVLNDDNTPAPLGEHGQVIVTSLYNRAMPFIRYRLGDIATLKPSRINGRRVLEKVIGRTNDVAILPSGRKAPGLTFYYVSKSLLEQSGMIKEFIIKQIAPTTFHFEYVADNELTHDQRLQVQKLMDQYLEPGLTATFERKVRIERAASGKFKHFQYLVK